MEINKTRLTRRDMLKVGSVGIASALVGRAALTGKAYADEKISSSIGDPSIKGFLKEVSSGETISSFETSLYRINPQVPESNDEPAIQLIAQSQELIGSEILYASSVKIEIPTSEEMIESAVSAGYIDQEIDVPDDYDLYVKGVLGVNWGINQSTIQIVKGSFEVSSSNPFISYSNTFYGMMQKEYYKSDLFNGQPTTINTGWPVSSFNPVTDQWTCGGAVGGGYFNLLNGQQYHFSFEHYF